VVLALFPNSDLRTAKLRPVLVVQADQLNTGLGQIVVAMNQQPDVSGRPSQPDHSAAAVARRRAIGPAGGFRGDGGQSRHTVLESALGRVIGVLPMSAVDTALRHTLNL